MYLFCICVEQFLIVEAALFVPKWTELWSHLLTTVNSTDQPIR
jgi:hypothetical protein